MEYENTRKIIDYVYGELSKEEHIEMAEHIKKCSECQKEMRKMLNINSFLTDTENKPYELNGLIQKIVRGPNLKFTLNILRFYQFYFFIGLLNAFLFLEPVIRQTPEAIYFNGVWPQALGLAFAVGIGILAGKWAKRLWVKKFIWAAELGKELLSPRWWTYCPRIESTIFTPTTICEAVLLLIIFIGVMRGFMELPNISEWWRSFSYNGRLFIIPALTFFLFTYAWAKKYYRILRAKIY